MYTQANDRSRHTGFIGVVVKMGRCNMLRLDADLAARLARIRLVLMDIDGTLLTADRQSFDNVIVQLRKLKSLGIGFSVATGRTIHGAAFVTQRLRTVGARMPPMITYNGGVVFAGQDSFLVVRHLIERHAFEALVWRCRAVGYSPLAYACGMSFDFSPRELVYSEGTPRSGPEFNGMDVHVVEDLLAVDGDFVAVLVEVRNPADGKAFAQQLLDISGGSLRITTSGDKYLEVGHPKGTKLCGMAELARMGKFSIDEIMAIGDNFNDLEMIQGAGVGIAVANAPAGVQAVATRTCSRVGAEGVVEALRVLTRSVRSMRSLMPAKTFA
jgi:hydroxymethylpyrimidine pyrophosphatase-like HAD family hydrolase